MPLPTALLRPAATTVTAAALLAGGVVAVSVGEHGEAPDRTSATVSPGQFEHPRPNRYFPLVPGTVSIYRGTDDGERLRERVRVLHRTKTIEGVRARVVLDVLRRADGSLAEKTHDWYAADNDGTVWYFGERTATYDEKGHLESREGSWKAGVDGAVAGIIMPADPRPTDAFRQEFYPRHAEDQAWIVQQNTHVAVPYGQLRHVVRTFEWSRLEKRVISTKLYGRGLGIVREQDVAGGSEVFELVRVRHR
jgi:hypothetical protein